MIGFQVLWRYGYNNVEEEINAEFDFDFPTEGSSVIASDDAVTYSKEFCNAVPWARG